MHVLALVSMLSSTSLKICLDQGGATAHFGRHVAPPLSGFVRVVYPKCYFMYIFSHITSHAFYFMHKHSIALMHTSHSCIIVTEPSEVEPVEPTESVEHEPGVPFAVEVEANQGKQLSMIPCSYLI